MLSLKCDWSDTYINLNNLFQLLLVQIVIVDARLQNDGRQVNNSVNPASLALSLSRLLRDGLEALCAGDTTI